MAHGTIADRSDVVDLPLYSMKQRDEDINLQEEKLGGRIDCFLSLLFSHWWST
jgi:hypothetical protein